MADSPTEPWQFCRWCVAKGPVPECALCEKLNGRPMTGPENEAFMEAYLKLPEGDWWLDVPFEDGTTPRQRSER